MVGVLFVSSTGFRNWALDHLANLYSKEIGIAGISSKKIEIPQRKKSIRSIYGWLTIPKAQIAFILHQDLGMSVLDKNWEKKFKHIILRYTHHNKNIKNYLPLLNICSIIIVENKKNFSDFINIGVPEQKLFLLPYPIDPIKFHSDSKSNSTERDIILVSNLVERKSPNLIFEVIKNAPDLQFTIYGKNWKNFIYFKELSDLSNLQLKNFNFVEYDQVLRKHRMFLSLSTDESGPVPLLEALACGLRILVTDTGTARDLIKNTDFIIPVGLSAFEVISKIRIALTSVPPSFDATQYSEAHSTAKLLQIVRPLIS